MTLLDLLRSPWAIEPERLHQLQAIYATHLNGDKIDIPAVEARLGRELRNNTETDYEVHRGGVALLSVDGVIAPKANLFTQISGGVSAQLLERAILQAIDDPQVTAMVLAIDSPGGNVHGVPEVAAAVRRLADVKPVVTLATGVMASAAYWIGSAANAVYLSGPTVTVGSIGVVATHDYSPREPGRVVTEITAGKYKRMASPGAPLTKEGRAYLQAQVDYLYSVFVDAVAQQRGTTAETVLTQMADGRLFNGQQAIDAGLADGVSALDQLMDALATQPKQFARRLQVLAALDPSQGAGAASEDDSPPKGASPMSTETNQALTRESLEQNHAALFAQIKAEFTAVGAAQERERIQAVREQSLPGHEALIERLAFDGQTTGPQAAAAVLAAERQARASTLAAHDADAPAPAANNTAPVDTIKTREEQAAEAKAYASANGLSFIAALKKLGFA